MAIQNRLSVVFLAACLFIFGSSARGSDENAGEQQRFSAHFQLTAIPQAHPSFKATYSGLNSLDAKAETRTSVSSTLFLGMRLWKHAEVYFDPEMIGGGGFSVTTGIAAFPNGEVYRISNPSPHVYVARFYVKQVFFLSETSHRVDDDANQLAGREADSYVSLIAGKFSIMDFLDKCAYSHDPRRQFFNWALMGHGAWDYPADTRGYTFGIVSEFVRPSWALRFGFVMVPTTPNGMILDRRITRSNSSNLEFDKKYKIGTQQGTVRLITYLTRAGMGNYRDAINYGILHGTAPQLEPFRKLGHTKYGFGISLEQALHQNVGLFFRSSWNDGHNETWAFTEIDRCISLGLSVNGALWHRPDALGIAFVLSGLSKDHRDFLRAGGYGFIIGDGNLNYGGEMVTELYYSLRFLASWLWITPDYQFILHPAYNRDRGPVHVFGIRVHVEI
jgi:high affinity Mn2+ porin